MGIDADRSGQSEGSEGSGMSRSEILKKAREVAAEKKKAISGLKQKEKQVKELEISTKMKELERREAELRSLSDSALKPPSNPAAKPPKKAKKAASAPPTPPPQRELKKEPLQDSESEQSDEEVYTPPVSIKSSKKLAKQAAKDELKRRIEHERMRIAYASLFPNQIY